MSKFSSKFFFGLEGQNKNPRLTLLSLNKTIIKYSANTTKFIDNSNYSLQLNQSKDLNEITKQNPLLNYSSDKKSNKYLKNQSDLLLLEAITQMKQKTLNSSVSSPLLSVELMPLWKVSSNNIKASTSKSKSKFSKPNSAYYHVDSTIKRKFNFNSFNSTPKALNKKFSIESGLFSKTKISKALSMTTRDKSYKPKKKLLKIVITSSLSKEKDLLSNIQGGQIPFRKVPNKIIKKIEQNYKKVYKGHESENKHKQIIRREKNSIERLIDYKKNKISDFQSKILLMENKRKIKVLENINDQVCLNHIDFLESKLNLNYGPKSNFVYEERMEMDKKINSDSFVFVENKQ